MKLFLFGLIAFMLPFAFAEEMNSTDYKLTVEIGEDIGTMNSSDFYMTLSTGNSGQMNSTDYFLDVGWINILYHHELGTSVIIPPAPGVSGFVESPPVLFKFMNPNIFETSFIHRSSNLPLPEEKVRFWVYVFEPRETDRVYFNYGFNKTNITTMEMLYNATDKSHYYFLGGYPPRTLITYYVTAVRNENEIRTPVKGYDVIVWDNPPITADNNLLIKIVIVTLALLILIVVALFVNRSAKKKDDNSPEKHETIHIEHEFKEIK
jgi:hypothetical protein